MGKSFHGLLDVDPVFAVRCPATARTARPSPSRPVARPYASRTERPVRLESFESLSFDVSRLSYVTAGAATRTVQDKLKITTLVFDESNKHFGRDMAFTLSNDARQLPVKRRIELAGGRFVMVLREAR